jgi:WhiB family redox-sensing transcriptional regulator
MEQAACATAEPDIFYPADRRGQTALAAKKICGSCPVQDYCLSHALTRHESHGIWGGLDEADRRLIRRRAREYPTYQGRPQRLLPT